VQRVGLIGLGTMGGGMASVLLKAGFPVSVFNRNRERAKPFEAQGARVAESPKHAAEDADVVIAIVADDQASREVWTSSEGVLAGAKSGAVLIECSTISPAWARELATLAARQGCGFLDAPVTGSNAQAASGTLRFLVGGDADSIRQAEPVLRVLSTEIIPFGPAGSGAVMKLINNMLCGVQVASLAEAIALIGKSGLDVEKALLVLTGGAPGSPLVAAISARMKNRDYNPHFSVRLMNKDLTYALQEGNGFGVSLSTAEGALEVFRRANQAGLGEKDIASVVEPLRSQVR
jgi:3-hydroxyisobutyrate dehydrogenase